MLEPNYFECDLILDIYGIVILVVFVTLRNTLSLLYC